MQNSKLLDKAINLATTFHAGQMDKVGEPYILHPLRVMFSFEAWYHDFRMIAVMHDLFEDTQLTPIRLHKEGFPNYVVEAVQLLTHPKGEPYLDYIRRIRGNSYAAKVKRADILDNMSMERMLRLDQETIDRLTHKYSSALKELGDG